MRGTMQSIRRPGAALLRLGVLVSVLGLALGLDCPPKGTDFFLDGADDGGPVDTTVPSITGKEPSSNVTLNDTELCFVATDAGSGVNVAGITAMSSTGTQFPVSATTTPNKFRIDITSAPEGAHTVNLRVPDNAGNVATETFTFTKDRTAPSNLTFSQRPAASGSSNAASVMLRFAGSFTEANPGNSMLEVRRRQGAECSPNDPLWPQGTAPGQVSANTAPITGNSFDVSVTAFNGVMPGGQPTTAQYCLNTVLNDRGVTKAGITNPNTFRDLYRFDLTWLPPPGVEFTVNLNDPPPGWNHPAGEVFSVECKVITTNPPQRDATYSVQVSGPGVIPGQTVGGMLDANGQAAFQVRINQTGTYTNIVTVTSGGVQRTGSASVTVTGSSNTCPVVSSSARFKRGVIALLPNGATILGLRPVAFRYVEPYGDPSVAQVGLIAEEVVRVFPQAVLLDAEGRPAGIYYGTLTGLVIGEIESRISRAVEAGIERVTGTP